MIRMMTTDPGFTGPVNLGNPTEFTILQLAETVLRLTASRSQIAFRSLPADDPLQRKPDIALARSALKWEPRTPLDEGLKPTIAYFKAILGL
jgi:UDP-glucuronate decarboxylase